MRAVFTRTLIGLTLASSQAAWAIPFQSQVAIDTTDNPISITSADFDGDLNIDLAVTSYNDATTTNQIKILLGNGDTTFDSAVSYNTGNTPSSITNTDLDGDTDIDLAVANNGDSTVSIFLNDSNGLFTNPSNPTTGTAPVYILAADLNGSNTDLVTVNSTANSFSVILNNNGSAGSFFANVDYATGNNPSAVTANDFDFDGDTDLAVTNQDDNTVSIFLNNGSGIFSLDASYATGTAPTSIASQEISGDSSYPDLVISNSDSNTISVLINKGASGPGTFNPKVDYSTGDGVDSAPKSVNISELNQDGDQFITVSNSGDDTVSIFANDGSGLLSQKTDFVSKKIPNTIIAADIDGDNYTDLITTNLDSHNFSYLKNLTEVTPADFTFTAQTDVARSTSINSNPVILGGLINSSTLSISSKIVNGSEIAEYSINGGNYISTSSSVSNGDTIRVRILSSALFSTTETATLTIGGYSTSFSVTTAASGTTPVDFSFDSVTNAEPSTVITSEAVTLDWLTAQGSIAIVSGEYSVNGAAFISTIGTVDPNDSLRIRLTSSADAGGRNEALVSINSGANTATFTVFTKSSSSTSSGGGSSSLSIWFISLLMTGALLQRCRRGRHHRA